MSNYFEGTAEDRQRRRGKIVGGEDATRLIDTVETADPFRGFLDFVFCDAFDFRFRWNAPGMVRLVIDHQNVAGFGGDLVFEVQLAIPIDCLAQELDYVGWFGSGCRSGLGKGRS